MHHSAADTDGEQHFKAVEERLGSGRKVIA
jgi:hypothetical protein